jgi:lycopene cyclase domain-containing protein
VKQYTYLAINLVTLLPPIVFGFDKRVHFVKKIPSYLPTIFITALFFIVWDQYFTSSGVWDFNREYITNIYIGHLPIEEVLFFSTIPLASIFIYEVVKAYLPTRSLNIKKQHLGLIALSLGFANYSIYFWEKPYSRLVALLGLILTIISLNKSFWYHFIVAYLVHLIPFLFVNGILTALPVVTYSPEGFSNIRLYTIPIEDFIYAYTLLLMNVYFFERYNKILKTS